MFLIDGIISYLHSSIFFTLSSIRITLSWHVVYIKKSFHNYLYVSKYKFLCQVTDDVTSTYWKATQWRLPSTDTHPHCTTQIEDELTKKWSLKRRRKSMANQIEDWRPNWRRTICMHADEEEDCKTCKSCMRMGYITRPIFPISIYESSLCYNFFIKLKLSYKSKLNINNRSRSTHQTWPSLSLMLPASVVQR